MNCKFYFVILVIFCLTFTGSSEATTYSKCLHSGWIPFKNEKCLKILNIYETHSSAIESCQKQILFDDLIEVNIPATLLTIGSRDESDFVDKLLFNISRYADNVWLGGIRDGSRGQFRWLDGTSLNNFSIYTKWAYGNPTGDFEKNCMELRSKEVRNTGFSTPAPSPSPSGSPPEQNSNSWWSTVNPGSQINISNPNPNAFFNRGDSGNWYNVPCTKHNLVVCQIPQIIPDEVVHLQLSKSLKEISKLKTEMLELKRLIGELASNVITDIRFGGKETTDIWQGSGFPDGAGYVITGVLNWDEDSTVDTICRRKVQKFVSGKWIDVY